MSWAGWFGISESRKVAFGALSLPHASTIAGRAMRSKLTARGRCTKRRTKTSLPCLTAPTVADYRTRNLLILRAPAVGVSPVTAEAAGSSPVIPATHSKAVRSDLALRIQTLQPTIQPTTTAPSSSFLPRSEIRLAQLVCRRCRPVCQASFESSNDARYPAPSSVQLLLLITSQLLKL